jgi:hypothetical protein
MKKLFIALIMLISLGLNAQTVSFQPAYSVGDKTHVPIVINNFQDISAISLAFRYDTAMFSYDSYLNAAPQLTSGMTVAGTRNDTLFYAWFVTQAEDPIFTDDTLTELIFINKSLGCSSLVWTDLTMITGLVTPHPLSYYIYPLTLEDNQNICVQPYNVSLVGSVKYHNTEQLIFPVNIDLYDTLLNLVASQGSGDGSYLFENIPCGKYTITASTMKTIGGINATDALFAAKEYVHLIQLDDLQMLAADINEDGAINSQDASLIMQKFCNNIQFPHNWVFEIKPVNCLSSTNECDLKGLVKGDVNNSFVP